MTKLKGDLLPDPNNVDPLKRETLVIVPLSSDATTLNVTLEPAEKELPLMGFDIETTGRGDKLLPPHIKLEQLPEQQSEL